MDSTAWEPDLALPTHATGGISVALVNLTTSVSGTTGASPGGTVTVTAQFANNQGTANLPIGTISIAGWTGLDWAATYAGGATGPASGMTAPTSIPFTVIPSGGSVTVIAHFAVPVNAPLGEYAIEAWVLPKAPDTLPVPSLDAHRGFGVINVFARVINVSMTKTLVSAAQPGGNFIFEIKVANDDTIDMPIGAELSDTFPAGMLFDHWTATYSVGTGPTRGVAQPLHLPPIAAGQSVTYRLYGRISHCLQPQTLENYAKLVLPVGYVSNVDRNTCVEARLTFNLDEAVMSPCRKFCGGIGNPICNNPGATYSGSVTIKLISETGKVWNPYVQACAGVGVGRYVPVGTYETIAVDANGCWESQWEYMRNSDLIDGSCSADNGIVPKTYWEISENIQMTNGPSFSNTHKVRLLSSVNYPACVRVDLADANFPMNG
jgi:hypothetical protein